MSETEAKSLLPFMAGLCYRGTAFLILYEIGLALAIWLHPRLVSLPCCSRRLG